MITTQTAFWSEFEEAVSDPVIESSVKTETRAREERDQRIASSSHSTMTATGTREERDQDVGAHALATIPAFVGTRTLTMTETREERDQDASQPDFAALPRIDVVSRRTEVDTRSSGHALEPQAGPIVAESHSGRPHG